jgi:hypothetical protein
VCPLYERLHSKPTPSGCASVVCMALLCVPGAAAVVPFPCVTRGGEAAHATHTRNKERNGGEEGGGRQAWGVCVCAGAWSRVPRLWHGAWQVGWWGGPLGGRAQRRREGCVVSMLMRDDVSFSSAQRLRVPTCSLPLPSVAPLLQLRFGVGSWRGVAGGTLPFTSLFRAQDVACAR